MESVRVERVDHLGVIASVIKDLGLIAMINARLVPDAQAVLTPGEAVAGMILNGLGVATRPLSLTPQFGANQPLALLFREGLRADMFNRFTRGRILDEASAYGCDLLCQELALAVCAQEGLDLRFPHLDTTRFALSGDDVPDRDAHAIRLTHGDSKAHRPDLKQAGLALMVSQDGGGPLVSQSWEGHTSDTQSFQERAQAFRRALKTSPRPRYLRADATRSTEDNAANLQGFGCSTRLATPISVVSPVIEHALTGDPWPTCDETTRSQGVELCHDGMAQRGLVVYAHAALARAEATVNNATQRDDAPSEKQLFPLHAKRVSTPEAAQDARATVTKGWLYHQLESSTRIAHNRAAANGRPTPNTPLKDPQWQIQAHVRPAEEAIGHRKQRKACFVLGTTIDTIELSDTAILAAYKSQARVEGGFRLLKDPRFFVSSLFVKNPCRIQGLLMVMTLAWLVYSVAQRRLRQPLAHRQTTVPHHINHPTAAPTLRWVFQLLDGMHRVRVTIQGQLHALLEGRTDTQIKVLRLFGQGVCCLYQISTG
jgi:transposase